MEWMIRGRGGSWEKWREDDKSQRRSYGKGKKLRPMQPIKEKDRSCVLGQIDVSYNKQSA